jgi:DNA-binding transcriptional ArsR family regulator
MTSNAATTTGTLFPVVTTPLPWLRAVRRTKMPLPRKGLALALATYANRDGTNAHPGVARLAADCGINEQSVRRHLKALRDAGLIVRTFRASTTGKKNMADSYDLTVPVQDTNHRSPVTGASETNHRSSTTETTGHQLPPTYKRTPSKRSPTRSVRTVRSVTADTEPMEDATTRKDQRKPRSSTKLACLHRPSRTDRSRWPTCSPSWHSLTPAPPGRRTADRNCHGGDPHDSTTH